MHLSRTWRFRRAEQLIREGVPVPRANVLACREELAILDECRAREASLRAEHERRELERAEQQRTAPDGRPTHTLKELTDIIARQVRAVRAHARMTQEEFARALGVSRSVLCRIELGRRPVKASELVRIAEIADRPVAELTVPP